MRDSTPSHRRPTPLTRFLYGACYYPEHWSDGDRELDAERMAAAGFNCVRLAEFAWDRIEPEEGQFTFGFFDQQIAQLAARGIQTILCTPTATPPRWLTVKHPEVMGIGPEGFPREHGSRQHASYSSPVFREYSRKITRAMATHFADNPNVIGWQTDNEFNCHNAEDYAPCVQEGFAAWLRARYGDIDALNAAWGTAFWAQTYARFEDVPLPRNAPCCVNPAHQLDYYRYLSDAVTAFQHDQVTILRESNANWFVFHNSMFVHIDYRGAFGEDLDLLGYDMYPMGSATPSARRWSQAFNLDWARAWTGNFIVPEHQSGPGGQAPYLHETPMPGEMRRMVYSSIAHGADSLLFFRWRTCRFGAELYWRGVLDHDNVPRGRYDEAARIGRELRMLGPELLGTSVRVDAAVATSDAVERDAYQCLPFGLPAPDAIAEGVHRELGRAGYAAGCVHAADDLGRVKLYVLPHWPVFREDWARALEAYVAGGGVLVVGARTATRDWHNNVIADTPPGLLRRLCGVEVHDYSVLIAAEERPLQVRHGRIEVPAAHWYETLAPDPDAEVLATWSGRHLDGEAAATLRAHGSGAVVYVGTYLTAEVTRLLLPALAKRAGLEPLLPGAPEHVEVVVREGENGALWFLMNHGEDPARVKAAFTGTDLLTGEAVNGALELPGFGAAVIRPG